MYLKKTPCIPKSLSDNSQCELGLQKTGNFDYSFQPLMHVLNCYMNQQRKNFQLTIYVLLLYFLIIFLSRFPSVSLNYVIIQESEEITSRVIAQTVYYYISHMVNSTKI